MPLSLIHIWVRLQDHDPAEVTQIFEKLKGELDVKLGRGWQKYDPVIKKGRPQSYKKLFQELDSDSQESANALIKYCLLYTSSRAFAVADHQTAHIYINDPSVKEEVKALLSATPGVEEIRETDFSGLSSAALERLPEFTAVAAPDAWFTYYYWLDDTKAVSYTHLRPSIFRRGDNLVIITDGKNKILYTTDGSEPKAGSPVYSQSAKFTESGIVKARCQFSNGKLGPVSQAKFCLLYTSFPLAD